MTAPAEVLEQRSLPAVITVTSLADAVANDGQVTLREALQAANTDTTVDGVTGSGTDIIQFDPSLTASGPATITLNGTQLTISSNLTIDGPGAKKLTIDANGQSRVFLVDDNTSSLKVVAINGLTLTKGQSNENGGAIFSLENLTLTRDVITNSHAIWGGGGVYGRGALTVDRSTITQNSSGEDGGGINAGTITVNRTTIQGNSATRDGGGLCAFGAVMVRNSTINQNAADRNGGGMQSESNGRVVVRDSTVSENTSKNDGGGINDRGGNLRVISSTISENSADGNGGGVHLIRSGISRFVQSTISGNSADNAGGGIFSHAGGARKLTVLQCTISGNSATHGGGIATEADLPPSLFSEQTRSPERANGDGSTWRVIVIIQNSIIAGNNGAEGQTDLAYGGIVRRFQNNLIGDPESARRFGIWIPPETMTSSNIFGQSDGNGGRTVIPISSVLETTLQNNGGPTKTLALVSGSAAIDHGGNVAGLSFDARGAGFARDLGGRRDIGAIEFA